MKTLLSAAALSLFIATSALAQTTPPTGDADKNKTTVDGMTVKTKVENDGKMKVKGKDDQGNRMKAYTKPRKGEMNMSDDMKMNHKGKKMRKGMMKDSTAMKSGM